MFSYRISKPTMIRHAAIILLTLLTALHGRAQTAEKLSQVTLKVTDQKTKEAIEFASATLVKAKDSSFVSGGLTGKEGTYIFQNVAEGSYLLKVSFVGYKSIWKPLKTAGEKTIDAGTFVLEEGILLNEVKLEGEVVAVKVKKDTTEFNTAAFKAAPDALIEDGIKKLPGIEVDKDGNIKSNGESVAKILVDGKEFFGGDPKMATRNLNYDAVAKVQLIDDKTEQAKATGIDDGKRNKVLNFILKDAAKKGWFGNVSMAGGTHNKFLGSTSANRFSNKKQTNFLMLSNNVNQTGFTSEDANNFGASRLNSEGGEGVNTVNTGGFNYANEWKKNGALKFQSNEFYSIKSNLVDNSSDSRYSLANDLYYNTGKSNTKRLVQLYRIGPRLDYQIDSLTFFNLLSNNNITFVRSSASNFSTQSDSVQSLINNSAGSRRTHSVKPSTSGSFTLRRRFRNGTGNVSNRTYWSYTPNDQDNYAQSENNFFKDGKPSIITDRLERTDNLGSLVTSDFNFNKSFKKGKFTLFAAPSYRRDHSNNDRNTLNYNPSTGLYEIRDDALSNRTLSTTTTIGSGIGFSKSTEKYNIYFNPVINAINLRGDIGNGLTSEKVNKNYLAFSPSASFSYTFSTSKRMSFNFSQSSSAPALNDLLVKQNNTDPLNIRKGNPDLKVTSNFNISGSYNTSNQKKKTYLNLNASYVKVLNTTGNFGVYDKTTGIYTSKPVNISGNHSSSVSASFVIPSKITGVHINAGVSVYNSRFYNYNNALLNQSDSYQGGPNLSVNYDPNENFSISVSNRSSMQHVHNTQQITLRNNYISQSNSLNINAQPVKKWRIVTDFSQNSYGGSKGVMMLNAGIQHYALDKNRLVFEFRGYDLLNNNSSTIHYEYDTSSGNTYTNNVRQYFYLKMTYRVNKTGGK